MHDLLMRSWLLLLLACGFVASQEQSLPEDLVVVFPTHNKRIGIINSTRAWRQGARAHIVVDDLVDTVGLRLAGLAYNETFSATPEFPGMTTAMRHVLAPILAHHVLNGQYKWMLLGDDDTVWSMPAVRELLQGLALPHSQPLAISDFLCHCVSAGDGAIQFHAPVVRDPRCVPCPGLAPGATPPAPACGCMLPPAWTAPLPFLPAYCPREGRVSFYGGTGVIYSVGLLELLFRGGVAGAASEGADPGGGLPGVSAYYLAAFSRLHLSGDGTMSEALRRHGVGFTHIPVRLSLPPHYRLFGTFSAFNDREGPAAVLARHERAARDKPEEFRRMVSAHVRQGTADHALYYDVLQRLGELMAQRGVGGGAGASAVTLGATPAEVGKGAEAAIT